jgi:hypothetical protein
VKGAQGARPTLLQEPKIGCAHLGCEQRVVEPSVGMILKSPASMTGLPDCKSSAAWSISLSNQRSL